jgi:hypothetical protein
MQKSIFTFSASIHCYCHRINVYLLSDYGDSPPSMSLEYAAEIKTLNNRLMREVKWMRKRSFYRILMMFLMLCVVSLLSSLIMISCTSEHQTSHREHSAAQPYYSGSPSELPSVQETTGLPAETIDPSGNGSTILCDKRTCPHKNIKYPKSPPNAGAPSLITVRCLDCGDEFVLTATSGFTRDPKGRLIVKRDKGGTR